MNKKSIEIHSHNETILCLKSIEIMLQSYNAFLFVTAIEHFLPPSCTNKTNFRQDELFSFIE